MTKIKNTKKGMAKKTLSISLAVAMLATSNVPVWAAEDLFTDGEVAVEAFTAEEAFSDEAAPAEEAPVVEEAEAPEAFSLDDNIDAVNKYGYKEVDLEMSAVGSWNENVSVEGNITDKDGKTITNLSYRWLADGKKADGEGAESTTTNGVAGITYKPVHTDFNKTLSVVIEALGEDNGVIYRTVLTGDKVKAVDVSDKLYTENSDTLLLGLTGVDSDGSLTYNGLAQRPIVSGNINTEVDLPDGNKGALKNNNFKWHYEVNGEEATDADLTNVTENVISVYGTLTGTYDINSPAYGYTANTAVKAGKLGYIITPYTFDKYETTLLTNSVVYTGEKPTFGLNDVKIEVAIKDGDTVTKKVDVTKLFEEVTFEGDSKDVGTGHGYTKKDGVTWADTTEAKQIKKNLTTNSQPWDLNGTYDVTVLDLAACTATTTKEYTLEELSNLNVDSLYNDIKLTINGKTFFLSNLRNDVTVAVNDCVDSAVANNTTGTIKNAFTIKFVKDNHNVKNTKDVDITAVVSKFASVQVHAGTNSEWKTLTTDKTDANMLNVDYIGKAYTLTGTSGALNSLVVNATDRHGHDFIVPSQSYTVSYDDNVNAGVVEVTITGKTGSDYAGAVKKVYFKINKDEAISSDFQATKTPTINPANNQDPSLYKDALGLEFKTTLTGDNTTATLKEGTDYTVKYYYSSSPDATSLDTIEENPGTNNVGQYVYAVATLVKDGNYYAKDNVEFVAGKRISEKSISNVTVAVEKDAYTFTGEQIDAKVTVKDGTVVLTEGEDYILQYSDNILVGTAKVVVVPLSDSGYDITTRAEATFEITPANAADVKITLKEGKGAELVNGKTNTFKYTGKQIKPVIEANSIKLNGVDVTKYFDITYPTYGENVNAGKEAGSVTVAPKAGDKNFTGTKTQLFNIQGKELNGSMKLYNGDKSEVYTAYNWAFRDDQSTKYGFYYDGTAQKFGEEKFKPEALVDVKEGVDYEIKYFNNVDAGVGVVAVVGKGNYGNTTSEIKLKETISGKETVYYNVVGGELFSGTTKLAENVIDAYAFKILPSYFTAKNIKVENGVYAGGKPVKPVITVEVNGRTLIEGTDYTVELTAIKDNVSPDEFVDATNDKPYYARIKAKGGYKFDGIYGSSEFIWGIDKKDLADCAVTVTKNGEELELKVMNGNVVELKEAFDVVDNGDGTATVSVVDGGKNYTGSQTVTIIDPTDKGAVGMVSIKDVKVVGNKATVILDGPAENAEGYDYVIATEDDYVNGRVDITKNQLKTTGDFFYVQNGTYYAYCHAYRHDEETGKKVFSPEFSERFKFSVTATTPDTPVITDVVRKGSTVTVTYNTADNAAGYDIVLGTASRKVNGEKRPVEYGTLVKKNQTKTTVTFTNVPAGTYYVGMHAYNRTSADGKKVFSPWANWSKKVTVK